ncbi:MAG: hypothetical protein LLG04_11315 [Parachlamydia sp.]|nr:hypothetical protein [Parachlamydia sp.]
MQYLSFNGSERKYPNVMDFLNTELPRAGTPWNGIALDLSKTSLTGQLGEVMRKLQNSHVKALDLSLNNLNDQDIRILADAAKTNRQLNRIVLCRNQIGDIGAGAIAAAMANNPQLQIDLQNNRIGATGAQQFAAACTDTNKETINLSHNQLGDQGARSVASQLHSRAGRIQSLYLTHNNIGEAGDMELAIQVPGNIKIYHRLEKVSLVEQYPGTVALCVLGSCGLALFVLPILDCLGIKAERPAEGCRYHKIMDVSKRQ